MGRKIHILCNDGSPLGVTEKSIYGTETRIGVGGAELALLTLAAGWQFYGNDVTLYNNPNEGGASSFKQKTLDEFNPAEDRDILVVFRSPNDRAQGAKGKKVWWSCDQYTVGNFAQWSSWADQIVCISPHHQKYFRNSYGILNTTFIDLPVRTWDYKEPVERVPKRCVFTSIPDRGLTPLHAAWAQIVAQVPDASLHITSDWRLWSEYADPHATAPYKLSFASLPNVTYLGAVPRRTLIQTQMSAELHLYPCLYEELFCISVAESQVAGTLPITSDYGSLSTTNMGVVLHGNPSEPDFVQRFVNESVKFLTDSAALARHREYVQEAAKRRFSLETILNKWEQVFDG